MSISTNTTWEQEEFAGLKLGDARLNQRATLMLERCAAKPTASFPDTFNGWRELMGAYRMCGNKKVTWRGILAPHWARSEQRAQQHPVLLAIQDTTELNYNGQTIDGLGSLTYPTERGMYLHATLLTTPAREPLGVVDAWMWARKIVEPKAKATDKKSAQDQSAETKVEQKSAAAAKKEIAIKESQRWIEGYERVAEIAARLPDSRIIYVADRESDIIELMARAQELDTPADWLVRAKHNRNLYEGEKLWTCVEKSEPLGEIQFTMAPRKGIKKRLITQQIRAEEVMLPAGRDKFVTATCIIAREIGAPSGQEPVIWRLLTNRRVIAQDDIIELIEWYRARWEIEIFFHVFKNGCTVESLQLDSIDKIQCALAIYIVVAWRIMQLMRVGRNCPELPAELYFDLDEIHATYLLHRKEPPKDRPVQINEVLRLVARLGGFLARNSDGEPGVKTIWRGIQRVRTAVLTIQILRENGQVPPHLWGRDFEFLTACV